MSELSWKGFDGERQSVKLGSAWGKNLKHEAGQEKKWNLFGWRKKFFPLLRNGRLGLFASCGMYFFMGCLYLFSDYRKICWKMRSLKICSVRLEGRGGCSEKSGGRSEGAGGRLEGHGDSSEMSGGCLERQNGIKKGLVVVSSRKSGKTKRKLLTLKNGEK